LTGLLPAPYLNKQLLWLLYDKEKSRYVKIPVITFYFFEANFCIDIGQPLIEIR